MPEVIVGLGTLNRRLSAIASPAARLELSQRIALRTVAEMKAHIPRKTSTTSRTLHVASTSAVGATIVGSRNALWLDEGTRPHVIRPKSKKALFFPSQQLTTARFGSKAVLKRRLTGSLTAATVRKYGSAAFQYATIVHHPGTRAQPYIVASVRTAFLRSGLGEPIVRRWNAAG